MKVDAIILAGGKGTRLKKVVSSIPKPMAPVNERPFLDILLLQINKFSCIKKAILAVGYHSEVIINHYKNSLNFNFELSFSIEKTLLGTGGAIKKALSFTNTQNVLVLNGDSYVEVDINDLIETHRKKEALVTVVLSRVENARRYGSVKLDQKGEILHFEEKSNTDKPGLINSGMYLLNRTLFTNTEPDKVISFEKELLPEFIKHSAYGYIVEGKFIDIGLPETYAIVGEYLR